MDDVFYEYAACGFGYGIRVTKVGSEDVIYFGNLDSKIKTDYRTFQVAEPGIYVTTCQKEKGSHKCFVLNLDEGITFDPEKLVLKGVIPVNAASGEIIVGIEYDGMSLDHYDEIDTDVKSFQIDYFRIVDGEEIEIGLEDILASSS